MTLAIVVSAPGTCGAHARERRVGSLVAQASHELRGPLAAARLGLHGLEGSARLAAVGPELCRAALALDDLSAAPRRRRAGEVVRPLDLRELLDEAAGAWHALAAAWGVAL